MLAKNQLLEEITQRLVELPFPLEEAWQRLRDDPRFPSLRHVTNIRGKLAEVGVRHNVERVAQDYDGRVQLDPISLIARTSNHAFRRMSDGCVNVYDHSGNQVGDYDILFMADGLPTLLEIKLRKSRMTMGHMRRSGASPSQMPLSDHLRPERVNHVVGPLQEYFRTKHCGYVMMGLPELLFETSFRQRDFKARGGILLPFYYDRETYWREVDRMVGNDGCRENP